MREKKKKIYLIGSMIVVFAIVVILVGLQLLNVNASDRFPGVESVIDTVNKNDSPFTILEIVPESGMGEIGYLVKDGEYSYITDRLYEKMKANSDGNGDRGLYYGEIKADLISKNIAPKSTVAPNQTTTYPLSSIGDYQESTFLSSTDNVDDWVELQLPKLEQKDIKGNYVEVSAGTGNYTDAGASEEGFESAVGIGGYDVTFTNDATTQTVKDNIGKYGTYKIVTGTTDVYQKVSSKQESGDSYFYVDTVTPVPEGTGNYNMLYSYNYIANHAGNYNFIPDEMATSVRKVQIGQVYYKKNCVSNEIMKRKVFAMSEVDDLNYPHFNIKVLTYTPEELQNLNDQIPDFDMLYIAGDTADGQNRIYDNHTMDYETTDAIMNKIFFNYTEDGELIGSRSVIVDYSILNQIKNKNNDISKSNVYKLVIACLQENASDSYKKISDAGDEGTNWVQLKKNIIEANKTRAIDNNFAKDNVYSFDTSNMEDKYKEYFQGGLVNITIEKKYDKDIISTAFSAISDLIDSENLIRDTKISSDISQKTVLQYIINAWNPRDMQVKETLNVLEIEPSYKFDLDEQQIQEWAIPKGETVSSIKVNLTQMTTAEFIGKVDDLNTNYDMVYIGMNTGRMNVNAGRTVYNDTSMNGLVYTHIGDRMIGADELAGLLTSDYVGANRNNLPYAESLYRIGNSFSKPGNPFVITTSTNKTSVATKTEYGKEKTVLSERTDTGVYRYSGNDLTSFKMKDLVDYVGAHYPLVVDSRVYSINNNEKKVDATYIDNSSYMYQLFNEDSVKNADNVITYNPDSKKLSDGNKLSAYLGINKLDIENKTNPKKTIQKNDSSDTKTLSTSFTITNNVETDNNTQYAFKFYIDMNADGHYTDAENINDCFVTYSENGVITEAPKEDGIYVLKSNTRYTVTKYMGSQYVGYISYKFDVYDMAYTNIRTSYESSFVMKGASGQKEQINILQIKQRSNGTRYPNNLDMSTNASFQNLIHDEKMSGYNITVTSMDSTEFENNYNDLAVQGRDFFAENNYNMLVIGFADVYDDISNEVAHSNQYSADLNLNRSPLGGILKFIQDGKSVLFTHDTTSFINLSSKYKLCHVGTTTGVDQVNWYSDGSGGRPNPDHWGYNVNSVLRKVVGMDRFGVTNDANSDTVKSGKILNSNDIKLVNANDIAYIPNSAKGYAAPETQGYSNTLLNNKHISNNYNIFNSLDNSYTQTGFTYSNMYAAKVNSGQITTYPFEIADTINVATTHYQYYQLDLEADDDKDSQSDIVVWYTLAPSSNNDYSSKDNLYAASPKDVRNNYYIYSKGNVMYSGVGHSTMNGDSDEMRLFINTIVAAYKNGVQEPTATIIDGANAATAQSKENEYLTFDDSIRENSGALTKNMDMYYRVEDVNLTTTAKQISVRYYVEDSNSTVTVNNTKLHMRQIDLATYSADGTTYIEPTALQSGNIYKVPISDLTQYLGNDSTKKIYVVLTSTFQYYGPTVTISGYDTLSIVRQQLFNLE